jgi:hypothetical protein
VFLRTRCALSGFLHHVPRTLGVAKVNQVYAALERIHHWQRQTTSLADEGIKYALGYAKDLFFDKCLHPTFNEVVDAVAKLSPNVAVPPKVESPNH